MVEDLPFVPPAVPLLIEEVIRKADGDANTERKRLKALFPELRKQSRAFMLTGELFPEKVPATDFEVFPDGGLDLFSGEGACFAPSCRVAAADQFCRSFGLIADRVWLTDLITEKCFAPGRPPDDYLEHLLADAHVLARLWPLIEAGVVRFRAPWLPVCEGCKATFEHRVDDIAAALAEQFAEQFHVEKDHGGFVIRSGDLFYPSIVHMLVNKQDRPSRKRPSRKQLAQDLVHRAVRSALWSARDAARIGGAVFSNSKAGIAGLAWQEGRADSQMQFDQLGVTREVQLPWVNQLAPQQIVQLRYEAAKALPALRELMRKSLGSEQTGERPSDLVQHLREQAVEVRNELEIASRHSTKYWNTGFVLLSLAVGAYGVATDQTAATAVGLLPLLQLILSHDHDKAAATDRTERRLGYVLVRAQEILQHAH